MSWRLPSLFDMTRLPCRQEVQASKTALARTEAEHKAECQGLIRMLKISRTMHEDELSEREARHRCECMGRKAG